MIKLMIACGCHNTCHTLSDNGSHCCPRYSHLRCSEQSENQNRIQYNICNSTAELWRHTENSSSRGSKQPLEKYLGKKTEWKYHNGTQIFNSKFHDFTFRPADLAGIEWFHNCKSQNQKKKITQKIQKCCISRNVICFFIIFLSQRPWKQCIHTDTGSRSDRNQQCLEWKCQWHRRKCILWKFCHKDAVHNIIQCLDQHRNHHRQWHIK